MGAEKPPKFVERKIKDEKKLIGMVEDKLIMKKIFLWKTFFCFRGRDDSAGTKNSINHRITNPVVSLLHPRILPQPVEHLRSIIF